MNSNTKIGRFTVWQLIYTMIYVAVLPLCLALTFLLWLDMSKYITPIIWAAVIFSVVITVIYAFSKDLKLVVYSVAITSVLIILTTFVGLIFKSVGLMIINNIRSYWYLGLVLTFQILILVSLKNKYIGMVLKMLPAVALLLAGIWEVSLPVPLVVLSVWLVIDNLMKLCDHYWYGRKKNTDENGKNVERINGKINIFVLVFVLLLLFIPYKEEPITWEKVKQVWAYIEDLGNQYIYERYLEKAQVSETFTMGSMGYNEEGGKVGGSVVANNMLMLGIRANKGNCNRIYLRGTVYDTYSGNGWTCNNEQEEELNNIDGKDLLYHLYGLNKCSEIDINDVRTFRPITLSFYIYSLRTTSAFCPETCFKLDARELSNGIELDNYGVNARFSEPLESKEKYEISFIEINNRTDKWVNEIYELQDLSEDKKFYNDEDLNQVKEIMSHTRNGHVRTVTDKSFKDITAKQLEDMYVADVNRYLELPDTIPIEVKTLVDSITMGCDNNYDKAKAIEAYLEENYTYTMEVGQYEGDVTDYFLFQSKQGYCTYFATAMTVLCRLEGIPARYVEGISYSKNAPDGELLNVSGSKAHAWCEVLLPGYGFVTIDATPGFESNGKYIWPEKEQVYTGDTKNEVEDTAVEDETEEEVVSDTKGDSQSLIKKIIYIAIGVIITIALIILMVYLVQKLTYSRSSSREKAVILMKDIRRYLEKLLKMKKGSSDSMGLRELIELYSNKNQEIDLDYLADFYEGVRYGSKSLSQEQLKYMENVCKVLKNTKLDKE